MRKTLSLALLALAVPVAATAQEPSAITVQGPTFFYKKTVLTPKTYKLVGRTTDGRNFRLAVTGRRVSGQFDGTPVEFVMPIRDRVAADTVLASLR